MREIESRMVTNTRTPSTPAIMLQATVVTGLVVILFWHVLVRLVFKWQSSEDWSHGFIIPLFSLYYLYIRRDTMPAGLSDHSLVARLAGAALLTLAYLLYLKATVAKIDYPKNVALVMCVMGIVLMTCGWPVARWSWFAVAFLMFAMPLPDNLYGQITYPLQAIAARVSAGVLAMVPEMSTQASGTVVDYMYQGRTGQLDVECVQRNAVTDDHDRLGCGDDVRQRKAALAATGDDSDLRADRRILQHYPRDYHGVLRGLRSSGSGTRHGPHDAGTDDAGRCLLALRRSLVCSESPCGRGSTRARR